MKVLFLGSSKFSKIVLNRMLDNKINVVAVITQPDKPSGRGHKLQPTEIKKFALEKNINVFTFDKVKNHIDEIKKIDYDVAIVASFGQILPQAFLDIKLTLNVHPSLLPLYRGATPIQSAILNGDKVTGVTIMKVAKDVDSGDIIVQKKFPINNEYYHELEEKLADFGGNMISEVLKDFEKGIIKFFPQDHKKATFVSKFSKDDGKLDFNLSKDQILNKIRAFSEEIGCYILIDGILLKIGRACDVSKDFYTNTIEPGTVLNYKKAFIIICKDGAIEILKCQTPSGKMISGRDFLNGHNEVLGVNILQC